MMRPQRDQRRTENPWCMMPQSVTTESTNGSAQIGLGLGVHARHPAPRRVPTVSAARDPSGHAAPQQSELPRVPMGGRPGPLRVRGSNKSTGDARADQGRAYWAARHADESIAESGPHHSRWSRRLQRDVLVGDMPHTRADCPEGPCPWVRCRHHMAAEVNHDGSLVVHHEGPWPGADLHDSVAAEIAAGTYETCGLRLAEEGARGIAEIADVMGLCRQQVAKDEQSALRKLRGMSFGASTVSEVLAGLSDDTGQDWPDWVV